MRKLSPSGSIKTEAHVPGFYEFAAQILLNACCRTEHEPEKACAAGRIFGSRPAAVQKVRLPHKAWWMKKMRTQDVEKIRKKRISRKKSLTFRFLYTIIYIVSYYADRQRHMPASRAGPMPVPIRKNSEQGGARSYEENVPAEEASALQGARLPQAHVHRERPQGTGSPSRKGSR